MRGAIVAPLVLPTQRLGVWTVPQMRCFASSTADGDFNHNKRWTGRGVLNAEPLVASGVRSSDNNDTTTMREPSFQQKRRFFGAGHRPRHSFGRIAGDHHLEKGLSSDAKRVAAEAEAEYHRARASLRQSPGGLTGGEPVLRVDDNGQEVLYRRLAVPFGETVVPSSKERFALRGMEGQLSAPRDEKWTLPAFKAAADQSLWLEQRIAHLIDAPSVSVGAKADQAGRLMADVWAKRLSLQPKTWNHLFALWGQAHAAPLVDAYEQAQKRISRRLVGDAALPTAGTSATTGTSSVRYLELMRQAYVHMRTTFTAPTPSVMETMMASLALAEGSGGGLAADKQAMHLANRILLDADKYVVLPTRTTYAAYFDICNRCELMDYAVTRFADAVDRLYIEPDASMATALLRGLGENGLVEEAVALLGRLEHIHIDVQLLNTSMEVLLLSQDARAALAAYEAVRHTSGIAPSSETFTLMLLACEKLGDWSPVVGILSDMQRHRIRGDPQCLNLLLKGLLSQNLTAYAHQLFLTMKLRNVDVWPMLASALPKAVIEAPSRLSKRRLRALVRERQRLRGNEPFALTRDVVSDARRVARRADTTQQLYAASGAAKSGGVAATDEDGHESRTRPGHQNRNRGFVDLDTLTSEESTEEDGVLPQLPRAKYSVC